MKNDKHRDTRVRFTRTMLRNAMLERLKEKPYQKITVKELCETAEINRGTFYLHYDCPKSLLKDIENQFVSENMQFFDGYWQTEHKQNLFESLFACIQKDRETFRLLIGPNGDPQFLRSMTELARASTVDGWQAEFPDYDRQKLDYLFDFVFPGMMALMQKWLENPQSLSIAEFTRRLERLGHYALLAVGEFDTVV